MDCLEFSNLRSLIYSDLAQNVAGSDDEEEGIAPAVELVRASVQTFSQEREPKHNSIKARELSQKIYLPASRVSCNIGFAQLATNLPASHLETVFPTLLDILNDIPFIDFEQTLAWNEWSLPDELVSTTVSAVLRIAAMHSQYRARATSAIVMLSARLTEQLKDELPHLILTQVAPAFHGFYRAIVNCPFAWSADDWTSLTTTLTPLLDAEAVEHLNNLLLRSHQQYENQDELMSFIDIFLSRYVAQERPLTGYFIVCSVMEIIWTVLAQTLTPPALDGACTTRDEAGAANEVWARLASDSISNMNVDETSKDALHKTLGYAISCFADLLTQIEHMDMEPSVDTYAWETMSESLKLATVCSVAIRSPSNDLLSRIKLLLSEESPVMDHLVQEAALSSTTVLVHNFSEVATVMSGHLRRFVTSPLPMFEYELASSANSPLPLAAAAKCLALCIRLSPGDDVIMSNMYSLLNYIAATSKTSFDRTGSSYSSVSSLQNDEHSIQSLKRGLQAFNEDQQRLIGISTMSVATCLALDFRLDEVTRLTSSMLLQRLRSAESNVESAIAYNLVELAVIAPENTFMDIVKAFSTISRAINRDDPRYTTNHILAAQTRLAQKLRQRKEFREFYLTELLKLFIDKGVALQNSYISNPHLKISDSIDQLASLLIPIDSLMKQPDFNLSTDPSPELATLFRNLWFIVELFDLTNVSTESLLSSEEWEETTFERIASKTPALVLEEVPDFVTRYLEYNTVIRKEYSHKELHAHKSALERTFPERHSEIKHLLPSQLIFLSAMLNVETLRSNAGLPSSLPKYFVNNSINAKDVLLLCMEAVVAKVMRTTLDKLKERVLSQRLPMSFSDELQTLLVLSCHRVSRVRMHACTYLNSLVTSFPSVLSDKQFVYAILEVLTLLRKACEGEFTDEYDARYQYHSELSNINLLMSDSYVTRNEILHTLHSHANRWFALALSRAPLDLQTNLQNYLVSSSSSPQPADLGASIALQFASAVSPSDRKIAPVEGFAVWRPDRAKVFAAQISSKERHSGESALINGSDARPANLSRLIIELHEAMEGLRMNRTSMTVMGTRQLLFRCAACLLSENSWDYDLLRRVVTLPFQVFSPSIISAAVEAWLWIISERPEEEISLLMEISKQWTQTIDSGMGFFSPALNHTDPFMHSIEYSPTDKTLIELASASARKLFSPHMQIMQFLHSRFQASRYQKPGIVQLFSKLVLRSANAHRRMSTHPLSREIRFQFLVFGFDVLKSLKVDVFCENKLRMALYYTAFSWFTVRPQWSYGANRTLVDADISVLSEFLKLINNEYVSVSHVITSMATPLPSNFPDIRPTNRLLRLLVENEILRLSVWDNPTCDVKRRADPPAMLETSLAESNWKTEVRIAWKIDPRLVVFMPERFKGLGLEMEAERWIRAHSREIMDVSEGLRFVAGDRMSLEGQRDLKFVLLWAPVTPVIAVTFFEPRYGNDATLLQYAHRVLEQHPVDLTFFFVPQIVQALRNDHLGYVKRFIFETARISQLFCHQIIWNMKANCFKDDAAEKEDPMKPELDKMTDLVVDSLSGKAREFYDREFGFFNEVTSISGKLKPYIKKSKPEKKAKIDEEMAKIKVEVGVYLPSNPDGSVVDIDRKSGRPLQSHAKAPFMATFKVRRQRLIVRNTSDNVIDDEAVAEEEVAEEDVWQAAIFKVGDDCRQDVLALQVIAMFKNIFLGVGLNLYLFPYRVTATGPGCGVIDVVPNATSRDEMGRAKINDLLGFFIAKYGGEDTISFQRARLNFIQSMAAYSVACYILQIKDRHNGNIMIDGEGHIVHIDFGFLFDIDKLSFIMLPQIHSYLSHLCLLSVITPGRKLSLLSRLGIKFEPNSFKLNHEMVVLMGGRYSRGYTLFQHLTVKAFLAIRPHAEQLINTVELMLGTELPSFKGEPTIKRLRERFALGLNERQAAEFMIGIIKNAHENMRSVAYDEFQRLQNGIPYK